jgi:hypothetical protein
MKTIITAIINYMQRYGMKQFERTLRIRGWE